MNCEDHLRWLHPFPQTGRGGAEELRQPASLHKAIVTIPNTHSPEPSQENAWPGLDIQREPRVSPKWASALPQSLRSSKYITNQCIKRPAICWNLLCRERDLSGHTSCITEGLFSHRLWVLILTLPFTKSEPISLSERQGFAVLCPCAKMIQGGLGTGSRPESETLVWIKWESQYSCHCHFL